MALDRDNVSLWRADGVNGFAAPVTIPTPGQAYPRSLLFADFDGDGRDELVYAGGAGTVTVYAGDGTGGFTRAFVFPSASGSAFCISLCRLAIRRRT